MRKTSVKLLAFTTIAFVTILLSNCKRGEDDPWLIFMSRDNRLTVNWELETYSINDVDKLETVTTFNSTACDTGNIGGTYISNVIRKEELKDTLLNSITNYVNGLVSITRIYDIQFTYLLTIKDNGTYNCNGSFSYFNPQLNSQVSGTFSSITNSWYWENSEKTKWAITFINFPTIDGSTIEQDDIPLKYVDRQTFDLRELDKDRLQFEYQTLEITGVNSSFNPYTLYTLTDTITNCQRTVSLNARRDVYSRWQFKKK
ncbi:MAG: hypothetical protein IPM47_17225 [Sphingobacteriales bacterium]|nr:MAG: hypothetical protein IPM47_17225 [Sphingobacteriales bacterium]